MNYSSGLDTSVVRLIEEAAEELSRFDLLVGIAPPAVSLALEAQVVAQLAAPTPEATRRWRDALVAARVDLLHAAAADPALDAWQARVDDEERRVRGGLTLSAARVAPLLAADADLAALDEALRPGQAPRPTLWRAVQALAAAGASTPMAELLPALLCCAAGMTDRVRLLPFTGLSTEARAEGLRAWRDGDATPLARAALAVLASQSRHGWLALKLLREAMAAEDDQLDALGRAAITARRALALLRESLATSMPDLATRLDCSRPAAGAALERLVEVGLAVEITGRARDRVFVHAGAWGLE